MRVHKKVISHDSGLWLICCWADCEKQGYDLYRILNREQVEQPVIFVFCSERHRQYFMHSHISHGDLPAGSRTMIG